MPQPKVPATALCQVHRLRPVLLILTGRITRLDGARWTSLAGSSRTGPRFFSTVLPWTTLFWVCFRQPLSCAAAIDLLGGNAVVVTTAGTLHVW
jgi:putative transposase